MFSIKINEIERKSNVDFGSLRIKNKINNEADDCSFRVYKTPSKSYRPELNDEVVIEKDGLKLFGGIIVVVDDRVDAGGRVTYNVKCADYSFLLKRRLVVQRYEDSNVETIIEDLIDNYTDDFTRNNVSFNKEVKSFSFNNLTVNQCLDKLAKVMNGYWYVDYDKDLHFFAKNSENAPYDLNDNSKNYIFNSLVITDDITQLRNQITVRGGTNPSETDRTETIISQDDDQEIFPLGYQFAELPIVKVNGVAVTVGADFLTSDEVVECLWSFQQKSIRFTGGNHPNLGDKIEVIGKILIPIIVRTPNTSSINENGLFEYKIFDDTIKTNEEAIERAIAELNAYSAELHEGSFSTYKSGLKAGQRIKIQSDIRDKSVSAIIQEVDLDFIDTEANQIKYSVRFATTKTLGIIEYIQQTLIDEKIDEDAQETLLNFIQQPTETFSFSDEGVQEIGFTKEPYYWTDDDGNTDAGKEAGVWDFSTWSDWIKTKVTINHAMVEEDLTDFPVYIDLADMPNSWWDEVTEDGHEIRVYNEAGTTEYPREVVAIDKSAKTGELWFKANLSSTVNTQFRIWAGYSNAEVYARDDTYGSDNVWGANAKYIGHFEGNADDSSTNQSTVTLQNDPLQVDGVIGKAYEFNGTDFQRITTNAGLNFNNGFVFSCKIKRTSDWNFSTTLSTGFGSYHNGVMLEQRYGDKLRVRLGGNGVGHVIEFILPLNEFSHIIIVYRGWNGSGHIYSLYQDGVFLSTQTWATQKTATTFFDLGRNTSAIQSCEIDEARLFIQEGIQDGLAITEYNNQNDPSTFYTVE